MVPAAAVKGKKGALSKPVAKKPTGKTAKTIQKKVLTKADKNAKNEKIKVHEKVQTVVHFEGPKREANKYKI